MTFGGNAFLASIIYIWTVLARYGSAIFRSRSTRDIRALPKFAYREP